MQGKSRDGRGRVISGTISRPGNLATRRRSGRIEVEGKAGETRVGGKKEIKEERKKEREREREREKERKKERKEEGRRYG